MRLRRKASDPVRLPQALVYAYVKPAASSAKWLITHERRYVVGVHDGGPDAGIPKHPLGTKKCRKSISFMQLLSLSRVEQLMTVYWRTGSF